MSTNTTDKPRKVTTATLRRMKAEGEKIAMLTAYDYNMAQLVDGAGMDVILVGDSATNVMAGNATTLPMTLDEMIYHARCVVRATARALVVCDMPFGSYQVNGDDAMRSAIRLMKEALVEAVKLEGGREIAPTIARLTAAGIPVMGHLGLTPQSVNQLGGYGLRAKEEAEAQRLIDDALALEQAGCFAIVLEKIPAPLAERVTKGLTIPTIGIGAGAGTDGQVLVVNDMLGLNSGFRPKFLRLYADLAPVVDQAFRCYISDVKASAFPTPAESY